MVSCTEFIPLYSELFTFIEEKEGYEGVVRYWEDIRKNYVEERLGALAKEKGLRGCWEYWSKSLNEEAADFTMTLDEEAGEFAIDMRYCPSRGLLNQCRHIKAYHDYCGHCGVLYAPVLARFGFKSEEDYSHTDEARCSLKFVDPNKTGPRACPEGISG
jgi:hypothetical protein